MNALISAGLIGAGAVALGVGLGGALGCYDTSQRPQVNDPAMETYPAADEQGPGVASTPCGRACAHLHDLHCPEADRVAGGTSCTTTCSRVVGSGASSFSPECVSAAGDVDAVRRCNVRCTGGR